MSHLFLFGLKHITCWLGKTPRFCIKSHHVLPFHFVRDRWSFCQIVLHLYFFSYQSQFIYHLRNYSRSRTKLISVSEQQNWFQMRIFTNLPAKCITYWFDLKWPIEWFVIQLQILRSTKPVILKNHNVHIANFLIPFFTLSYKEMAVDYVLTFYHSIFLHIAYELIIACMIFRILCWQQLKATKYWLKDQLWL